MFVSKGFISYSFRIVGRIYFVIRIVGMGKQEIGNFPSKLMLCMCNKRNDFLTNIFFWVFLQTDDVDDFSSFDTNGNPLPPMPPPPLDKGKLNVNATLAHSGFQINVIVCNLTGWVGERAVWL